MIRRTSTALLVGFLSLGCRVPQVAAHQELNLPDYDPDLDPFPDTGLPQDTSPPPAPDTDTDTDDTDVIDTGPSIVISWSAPSHPPTEAPTAVQDAVRP
jgi:hypothetical protein